MTWADFAFGVVFLIAALIAGRLLLLKFAPAISALLELKTKDLQRRLDREWTETWVDGFEHGEQHERQKHAK